jgi:hypothetical protein
MPAAANGVHKQAPSSAASPADKMSATGECFDSSPASDKAANPSISVAPCAHTRFLGAHTSTSGLNAAIVFQAAQAHWLSACLRVMLELKVADHLVAATDATSTSSSASASAPAGEADHAAAAGGVELQQVGWLKCGCSKSG